LGHGGIFVPECIYFWGDYFSETYGWLPSDQRTDKLQASRWHKWEWVSGLELAYMMIEYYQYTLDKKFLRETALPFANDVLTFFDRQYKCDDDGKLYMQPSQACETWWECTNPMPEIAGLHAVTRALLDLPHELSTTQERSFWHKFQSKIPDIPTREVNGTQMLAPAAKFDRKMNIENPELYAVFPFRLITFRESRKDIALQALYHREDRGNCGWRQEDIVMAYLGLADSARIYITGRAKNSDKNMRFPAFWGPNYDWTPDQCHGGVLTKALQAMALQTKGDSIYLFPAWPREWNANIRLHAPKKTTINATIKDGKITDLHVEPISRKKDIVIFEN